MFSSPAVISGFVLLYLAYTFWTWRRLSHIPGPFWAGFSKFWIIREGLLGRQPTTLRDVTNKHGSLVRIGPNELVTSDPDVLRKIMSVRSAYTRGPWYDAWKLEAGKDNLFCMRDEVAHMKLRNRMTAGYSGKENESMELSIENQVANLVKLLKSAYTSNDVDYCPVDLAQKLQYFTLDVISDLAFGKPLGYLQHDADPYDYVEAMDASMPVLASLGNVPWLANLFHSPLLRRFLPSEKDRGGFGAIIRFSKRIVAERFDVSARSQRDMLASFIRHGLNEAEASGEALLQVVAGADTTATGLKTIMLSLMTNPAVYKRLQAEIEDGVLKGTVSLPIKDSEARQLPYLQAVIKEGLRIRSPAGGAFYKMVPSGGDTINGFFVPEGTQIGVSHLSFLHSKQLFGEDAQVFRPERWLDSKTDAEHLRTMNSTLDMIFHSGKYQCLGKSVALLEFNKIFVELLRTFDFSVINDEKPARITNAGVWLIKDFWVRVTVRQG